MGVRSVFFTEEFQRMYVDTSLQEVRLSPPFKWLAPKEQTKGKRRGMFQLQWRNLANTTLIRWPRVVSSITSHVANKGTSSLGYSSPKPTTPVKPMRKPPGEPKLRDIQNTWWVLLKSVRTMKNKEQLRNGEPRGDYIQIISGV